MARRPLTDPIADAISGLSQAVTSGGDNQQWQQNVTQTTEQFTGVIADAVVERITPTITNATRRTSSSSRSRGDTASQAQAASNISGNVLPGHTFQPSVNMDDIPDLNNPPRFSSTLQPPERTVSTSRSGGGPPQNPPNDPPEDRTSRHAEEARRIVEDIANTATATAAANGNIPPTPPGNGPPEPPEPQDDDDNNIQRMLLEYLRRLLGIDFGDLANIMSRLTMNATNIIGGNNSMNVPNGPAGHAANLMDTIADYFNVPRETEAATIEAQEHLRRSIDRLTEATDGASGTNPAQPQGRFARIRSFFSRRRGGRRGGMATATRIASFVRPVLTRIGNLVPQRFRNTAAQFGQNVVGGMAQRFGIPAATAARFGQALGPALVGLGILRVALPILGTGIAMAGRGLKYLSDEAMKTTLKLAHYSGMMAAANAHLEVGREMRNFRIAQGIQGHGGQRIRLQNRIEEEWVPITTAMTNIGNQLGIIYDNIVLIGLKFANKLGELQVSKEEAFGDFNQALRDEINKDRAARGLPPLRDNEGPQANAGGNQGDERRFPGREAIFGQNAVDMVDFNRRNRGPRRPVNPNGGGN
jgi:hypothetical protein